MTMKFNSTENCYESTLSFTEDLIRVHYQIIVNLNQVGVDFKRGVDYVLKVTLKRLAPMPMVHLVLTQKSSLHQQMQEQLYQ